MPYIDQDDRIKFDHLINEIGVHIETEGDLNYVITRLCHDQVVKRGVKYKILNSIVGVLESAKLEFYRRIVAPYEDGKKEQNGDVGIGGL